jgi:hypothetical protein
MAIELAVSRAITKIHALERALHEPGPWYIRTESSMVPADRQVTSGAVIFRAFLPEAGFAELWLRDEFVIAIGQLSGGHVVYELTLATELAQ